MPGWPGHLDVLRPHLLQKSPAEGDQPLRATPWPPAEASRVLTAEMNQSAPVLLSGLPNSTQLVPGCGLGEEGQREGGNPSLCRNTVTVFSNCFAHKAIFTFWKRFEPWIPRRDRGRPRGGLGAAIASPRVGTAVSPGGSPLGEAGAPLHAGTLSGGSPSPPSCANSRCIAAKSQNGVGDPREAQTWPQFPHLENRQSPYRAKHVAFYSFKKKKPAGCRWSRL